MMLGRSFLAPMAIGVLVAGCTTTVPISVRLPKAKDDPGKAVTSGYTGTITSGTCTGSFTGTIGAETAPAAMTCSGKTGYGTVVISGGELASGIINLSDGTTARIVRRAPDPVKPTGNGRGVFGPVVDLYDWGAEVGGARP